MNHNIANATSCELRLLGGFELRIAGTPIELQPAVERMVAFVALTPRGVNRDFAAFQIWPDKDETRARANLRSTLWRLKKLAAEVVDTSATRLRLATDVWVDTQHLAEQLADPRSNAPLPFESLLAHLLPDWYDEWLIVERERLRQCSLASLERRARDALCAGEPASAIQFALAAVAIEGSRSSCHELVVAAHLAEGNESEAARERSRYERCCALVDA